MGRPTRDRWVRDDASVAVQPRGAFHLSEQSQQQLGEATPCPPRLCSSSTERSRCGGSIQAIVSGYGVTMRARRPDKDHTDLSGAGRE